MRKRHALHCKAGGKTGAACEFEDIDAELREVPGIGLVACAMPVAEMPELGRISGEQAAALVASIHNKDLKVFADRLRKEGKPHKLVITAVARKLVVIANALCKSRQPWTPQTG